MIRVGELLDGEEDLMLSDTCGFIAELVEVFVWLGFRVYMGGWFSRGGVRFRHGGMGCGVSNLGYVR